MEKLTSAASSFHAMNFESALEKIKHKDKIGTLFNLAIEENAIIHDSSLIRNIITKAFPERSFTFHSRVQQVSNQMFQLEFEEKILANNFGLMGIDYKIIDCHFEIIRSLVNLGLIDSDEIEEYMHSLLESNPFEEQSHAVDLFAKFAPFLSTEFFIVKICIEEPYLAAELFDHWSKSLSIKEHSRFFSQFFNLEDYFKLTNDMTFDKIEPVLQSLYKFKIFRPEIDERYSRRPLLANYIAITSSSLLESSKENLTILFCLIKVGLLTISEIELFERLSNYDMDVRKLFFNILAKMPIQDLVSRRTIPSYLEKQESEEDFKRVANCLYRLCPSGLASERYNAYRRTLKEVKEREAGELFAQIVLHCDGYLNVKSNVKVEKYQQAATRFAKEWRAARNLTPHATTGQVEEEVLPQINEKLEKQQKLARFLEICNQLPMELQMVMANRYAGLKRDGISSKVVEEGLRNYVEMQ